MRARYAQHCFMAHMDFRIGSGLAGIHEGGNVVEDVRFYGGQYGIWTRRPSPGWQFTVVDAVFEGQREAAIREREAGLTLVRPHFHNVPTAIAIDADFSDELWVKDARMEDITGPAVVVSAEKSVRTEVNMEGVVCRRVPVFAVFRESGKKVAGPGAMYEVKVFSHGLNYAGIDAAPEIKDIFETAPLAAMPAPVKSDLPDLPARDSWVNIRSLGAKGDGATDDTAVLRKAIAGHRAIYFPTGKYVVTDTITLKPDTVLIGLHPSAAQIDLLDGTPAFQGVGGAQADDRGPERRRQHHDRPGALHQRPESPGGGGQVDGRQRFDDERRPVPGRARHQQAGWNPREPLQQHSHRRSRHEPALGRPVSQPVGDRWRRRTFFDIWTPSTFAQAGMLVSDTSTEGRVYQMSSEHHVRHEMQLHNASNWRIYALQTEEERGEGGFALPLEIDGSSDITVANFHIYRVISTFQPFPWAVKVSNSRNIRFRNIHCYSNSKVSFDVTVYDQTHDAGIRQREFAWLTLSGRAPQPRPKPASPVLAPAAKVGKLAGGFYNISGGAVDPAGDFYFVDAHWQRIYRWSAATHQLSTVRDNPLDPVNLAFDKAGNLLVVSYAGNGVVYAFKPGEPEGAIQILTPEPAVPRSGAVAVLAVSDYHLNLPPRSRPYQYVSPDGTTFISAGQDFFSGAMSWGVKSADLLRGFSLAPAAPGKPFYMTDESELKTYSATVGPDGAISSVKLFAEQGGEGVAVDSQGNVYIAAGHIYVYNPSGALIDTIEVPERPLQLAFGGNDGQTLFIPARSSLYAVRTRFKGR